ncbi:low-complexity protein [Methylophaga lonarensis MPL]|uniref:Low-complexity protein n=1 Tax=Methylophaga lonarensis MPL TaxID=1286106 RepID=M7NVA0_9GAMM|nr:low-complexity protein [Methylophaga lonarensis]EMR12688.1 low-complexity protein [Methylophaga lonarensis MPL]
MNSNTSKKANLSLAMGAALTAGLVLSPAAVHADSNPFATAELTSGYMQLAKHHAEGKCGEGKCGAADGKDAEGKCGAGDKDTEGKCGEGKCGGSN